LCERLPISGEERKQDRAERFEPFGEFAANGEESGGQCYILLADSVAQCVWIQSVVGLEKLRSVGGGHADGDGDGRMRSETEQSTEVAGTSERIDGHARGGEH
jgi:hypothetical protein